jgi:hypothetical protein
MMKQSSIKFVAGVFALLLMVPALAGINNNSVQTASAATATGIVIPLYTYPGGTWNTVVETKKAHPDVPIVAIVNPASGPGGSRDSNYVSGIGKLKDAGVIVIGYVSTAYTNRALSAVKSDIDKWASWYDVDGIFFDEQTNWSGKEWYYTQAGDYAESKGLDFTVGNPGANSLPSYLDTVDVVLIYESPGLPNLNNYRSWDSYDNAQLGMIPFGVGSLPTTWIQNAKQMLGWLYVTNDVLPNPWDSLPSYFDNMVALLDDGSSSGGGSGGGGGTPQTQQYGLTVRSVDQDGKAINGMWMEVKKDGSTVKTGFTPLSLTLEQGTYTVSAANYKQIIFDHWSDGSQSSSISVNLSGNTELTAHYNNGQAPKQPPSTTTLTVTSVDLDGKTVTGLWTVIKKDGSTVKTGYTPLTYTAQAGSTYEVSVANYKNYVFDHWESGSKSSTRQVTMNADTTLTAYYNTGSSTTPSKVTITIKSVGLDGSPITGLWTVISGAGSATGFTPLSYTANAGSQYTITMGEWQNFKFDHWDNGSTSKSRTVTPNGNIVLTAYYRQ